jgi:hypothetical protein
MNSAPQGSIYLETSFLGKYLESAPYYDFCVIGSRQESLTLSQSQLFKNFALNILDSI